MKTKRLTESAMLLALAIVLELISKAIIPEMPFGGQVTLVAMLPVVLISYRYGVKWGFVSGFCYALLEMALGAKTVSAAFQPGYFGDDTMIFKAILMCLLDYLVAYTMMGLGGIFRDKIKNPGTSLMCGSLVALGARYLSHSVRLPAVLRLGGVVLHAGWLPRMGREAGGEPQPRRAGLGLFHCVQRLLHGSRADPHRHRGAADRQNSEDRGQG